MIYLELFVGFLKVGLFSFGGGYAAIPVIRDVINHYGWMNEDMLTYMIAVSESTPGPIMVNLATYAGSTQAGIIGAAVATFAVVLPAFIMIVVAVAIMEKFIDNDYVQAVLQGLIPCIAATIAATGIYSIINLCIVKNQKYMPDYKMMILTIILGTIYFGSRKFVKKGLSPIGLIALSAVVGAIFL